MRRVAQHYDAEVGETGLKGTQYALLSCVVKLGPVRFGDLAWALKVEASTLSRNLKPMAAAGWLALDSDRNRNRNRDRRSRSVSITNTVVKK